MLAIKGGGSYRCKQQMTATKCRGRYTLNGNAASTFTEGGNS